MSEQPDVKRSRDIRFGVAAAASVLIAVGAVVVYRWAADPAKPPTLGDWGSFFGGVSSSIALVWIVVAYLQQNQELRHQLREFAASVEAQRRQATATEESMKLAAAAHAAADAERLSKQPTFRHGEVGTSHKRLCTVGLILGGGAAARIDARSVDERFDVVARPTALRIEPGQLLNVYAKALPEGEDGPPLPDPFQFNLAFLDSSNREFSQRIEVRRDQGVAICHAATPAD